MNTPHPDLLPLLEAQGLTWEAFRKRGRPPDGVRAARSAIVTSLHAAGRTWADMMAITGLSNGAIQNLTCAMHNPASKENQREVGRRVGQSWAGKSRPGQLEAQWQAGTFDFHRGRVRSEEERAKLRAGWTPEHRLRQGLHSKARIWGDETIAVRLRAFHADPAECARRSQAQVRRMLDNPNKYVRGRVSLVQTPKGTKDQIKVRSSYEVAAVALLEADTDVVAYEYERVMEMPGGKWILPDFIVTYRGGRTVLLEVKASWVLGLPPTHKVTRRLALAEAEASSYGWGFTVWTEKELGDAIRSAA